MSEQIHPNEYPGITRSVREQVNDLLDAAARHEEAVGLLKEARKAISDLLEEGSLDIDGIRLGLAMAVQDIHRFLATHEETP